MDDLDLQRAEQRVAAFLARPEHQAKGHGKPELVEDDVAEAVAADLRQGPPAWARGRRRAPHGWHRVDDTFEED